MQATRNHCLQQTKQKSRKTQKTIQLPFKHEHMWHTSMRCMPHVWLATSRQTCKVPAQTFCHIQNGPNRFLITSGASQKQSKAFSAALCSSFDEEISSHSDKTAAILHLAGLQACSSSLAAVTACVSWNDADRYRYIFWTSAFHSDLRFGVFFFKMDVWDFWQQTSAIQLLCAVDVFIVTEDKNLTWYDYS